jgi:Uma2 family endonuclease
MSDVLATVEIQRRRFTVEEYYRMGEVGILGPTDRVELIEGELIEMSPISPRNAACVTVLNRLLLLAVGDGAVVSPRNPVRLLGDTEPQPDVVLLRPPLRRYWEHTAAPPDALLVVEVSDTSYRYDRYVKLPLYARAGIPEVWIVDLAHAVVEVFREPGPAGYAFAQRVERGGTIAPAAFPDAGVTVAEILPPSPGDPT